MVVHAMEGQAYLVSDTNTETLTVGEEIKLGAKVRTAKDAGAVVKLPDGSLIEMRERSEFSVTDAAGGTTIHLDRGNIIVQAAKQTDKRHLYVQTQDCLVSVVGTIFSVNNGTKGSRVSVVEGRVDVQHGGNQDVLHPGDQVATNSNLESVPVKDEIAWSRRHTTYPVVDGGRVVGLLAFRCVAEVPRSEWELQLVRECMIPRERVPVFDEDDAAVDALADLVHMSVSSFHQHFKAVTSMSPLQYQKALRLQEARRLMLSMMVDAGTASWRVGYQSASQFSREYGRFFGCAPTKDIARLREHSDLDVTQVAA